MGDFSRTELRLMQDLSQRVSARRPELVNGDATVGELAWVWGMAQDTFGPYWRRRLWSAEDRPVAWGWARLPYRIPRDDGTFRETKSAELVWQTDPDRPELIDEVLDWYDEVAGDVDRTVTVQSADVQARGRVEAHGFVFDAKDGGDDGGWIQTNERDLVDVPEPVLPEGFRFVTSEDVSAARAVKAHRDAWPNSRFTEAGLERIRGTWPYRGDLHGAGRDARRVRDHLAGRGHALRRVRAGRHPRGLPSPGSGVGVAVARHAQGQGGGGGTHGGRLPGRAGAPVRAGAVLRRGLSGVHPRRALRQDRRVGHGCRAAEVFSGAVRRRFRWMGAG